MSTDPLRTPRFAPWRAVLLAALLSLTSGLATADDDPVLRPSARLLFQKPDFLRPGSCVMYREGGSGWIISEPTFHLTGRVVDSRSETRRLSTCPVVPGKNFDQYNREEFVRHARAFPCLAASEAPFNAQVGVVRVRVERWETPHAKRAANQGRLYRGQFLDQALTSGLEVDLEADLLDTCTP